jgi:hypothetical protein
LKLRLAVLSGALFAMMIQPTSAGLLNDINDTFQGTTAGWLNNALNVADALFGSIMFLFIVFVLAKAGAKTMTGEQHFGTVLWPLGEMVLFLITPLVLLKIVARDVLPNLITDAAQISGMVTGSAAQLAPDDIFDIGLGKAGELLHATVAPLIAKLGTGAGGTGVLGIFSMPELATAGYEAVVGVIVFLVMIVVFALIACEVLAVYLDVYIAIAIGAINLGWMASKGTSHMANPFLAAVWSAVLRLIVVFSFVALVANLLNGWAITAQAADPAKFMKVAGELLAASLVALYMTIRLGRMADKVSGGAAAFSGTEALIGTATQAARLAARAA